MAWASGEIEWVLVDPSQFLGRANEIRVCWLGQFAHTDTKVRQVVIQSNMQWKEFSGSCLLPRYKNGKDWSDPDSENFTLQEYARFEPLDLINEKDLVIMTAYHTLINKRLIVDGCKRAVALETTFNKGRNIPPARVLECFGSQVHSIFPMDFNNLMRKALMDCRD